MICFWCGQPLRNGHGDPIPGEERLDHGNIGFLHPGTCTAAFDAWSDEESITAQPSEHGRYTENPFEE